ncbi:unnamed protein product [Caenorhabditis sp. 36 PRJEB53466]|nr:unnamed protein product [Caenorhabditis sp. 36 PRJEB53466]
MISIRSVFLFLLFLTALGLAEQLGTILGVASTDSRCENIKCYGQNECEMVETLCLNPPCELQPLCKTVIF